MTNKYYWKVVMLACGKSSDATGIDWYQVVRKAKREDILQILYFGLWEKDILLYLICNWTRA